MSHLPFFQFYPADWLQDVGVLSLEQRGAWLQIMCALHLAPHYGEKTWLIREAKQYLGYPEDDRAVYILIALESVADIVWRDDEDNVCDPLEAATVHIVSRRMVRDNIKRIEELERKRKYERKHPTRRRRKSDINPTRISQKSEVRSQKSDPKIKNQEPASPHSSNSKKQNRFSGKTVTPETVDATANVSKIERVCRETNGHPAVPANQLDPRIKEPADEIYQSDRQKFDRLIAWVKRKQKDCYSDEAIAAALWRFKPHAADVKDWYPYLDSIIKKVQGDLNARNHEENNESLKRDEAQWAREMLGRGIA